MQAEYGFKSTDGVDSATQRFDLFFYLIRKLLIDPLAENYADELLSNIRADDGDDGEEALDNRLMDGNEAEKVEQQKRRLEDQDRAFENKMLAVFKPVKMILTSTDNKEACSETIDVVINAYNSINGTSPTSKSKKTVIKKPVQTAIKYPNFRQSSHLTKDMHRTMAYLAATFRAEYLLHFSKAENIANLELCWIDESQGKDLSDALDKLDLSLRKISSDQDNEKRKELGEFLRKLHYFEKYTNSNTTADVRRDIEFYFENGNLENLIDKDAKKSSIQLARLLLNMNTTIKVDQLENISKTIMKELTDSVFFNELFESEGSSLWDHKSSIGRLVWYLARFQCQQWELHSPGTLSLKPFSKMLRQLDCQQYGMFRQLGNDKGNKMLNIWRYHLKNSYSFNFVSYSSILGNSSLPTKLTYGVYEGSGVIWKNDVQTYKFPLDLYVEAANLRVRTIFEELQVRLSLSSNLAEDFSNVFVFYDMKCERLRFYRLYSAREKKPEGFTESANDFLNIIDNNKAGSGRSPNYHAVSFPKSSTLDKCKIIIALVSSEKTLNESTSNLALNLVNELDTATTIPSFVANTLMPKYIDGLDVEAVLKNLIFYPPIAILNEKQMVAVAEMKKKLKLDSPASTATLEQVKEEIGKIMKMSDNYSKPSPTVDGPAFRDIDFIISFSGLSDNFKVTTLQSFADPIKIRTSITEIFDQCFKSDQKETDMIEYLSSKKDQNKGKMDWLFNLNFYLPMYYFIDATNLSSNISIFSELEMRALRPYTDGSKLRKSCRYKLWAFLAGKPESSDQSNLQCIYEIMQMPLRTLAKDKHKSYHTMLKRYLLESECKSTSPENMAKNMDEAISNLGKKPKSKESAEVPESKESAEESESNKSLKFLKVVMPQAKAGAKSKIMTGNVEYLMLNQFKADFRVTILVYSRSEEF